MAGKRLIRVQSLLAKVEVTEGTDVAPATANAIRPAGPVVLVLGAEVQNTREGSNTETLGRLGPLAPSAKHCTVTIPWKGRGFGAAYSASNLPEADPLFQSCALSQTVVVTGGSESVTYDLLSTGQKSCTIYIYDDGKLHKITGARGDVSFAASAGQPGIFTFVMQGIYNAQTDTALVAGTYAGATAEPLFRGASSLLYNAVSVVARSYEAKLGNTIAPRLSANATDGLAGFHVTGRAPTASFTAEDELAAVVNYESDWAAGTAVAVDAAIGSTQYNKYLVKLDKFTVSPQPSYAEDNGLIVTTVPGIIGIEGTEDFSILFN